MGWGVALILVKTSRASIRIDVAFPLLHQVQLCLGLHRFSESCVGPELLPHLQLFQRVNMFGLRDILWRKDAFCSTLKVWWGVCIPVLGARERTRDWRLTCTAVADPSTFSYAAVPTRGCKQHSG